MTWTDNMTLEQWARWVAEFMASDKSNDWSTELTALDVILSRGDIPEGACCDECGREDRPLVKVDDNYGRYYLCDRHSDRQART
jgi:hypothetical protein